MAPKVQQYQRICAPVAFTTLEVSLSELSARRFAKHSLVAPSRWMVDPLLEGALEVWNAFCTAPEPHSLAQIVSAFAANTTLAARNTNFESHPVTYPEATNAWADGNYSTGRLMPKRQWATGAEVSIGKLFVVRYIRATNAGRTDSDLQLS